MAPSTATSGLTGAMTYHWTQVDNLDQVIEAMKEAKHISHAGD